MKQILYILSKSKLSYGSFDKGKKGEFPIKAYLGILCIIRNMVYIYLMNNITIMEMAET